MPQGSTTFHEAEERLTVGTRDMHRAIVSLMEELEAVDWYQQRSEASDDAELRAILAHNREEEKEHACMLLEWIRRRDPGFDDNLRQYLFKEGSIVRREREAEVEELGGTGSAAATRAKNGSGGATVGSLRGGR